MGTKVKFKVGDWVTINDTGLKIHTSSWRWGTQKKQITSISDRVMYLVDTNYGSWEMAGFDLVEDLAPMATQVGGTHYKSLPIQPIEFITKNNLGWCEGNIIKYTCRWKQKGGIEDIDKVIHYAEILKGMQTNVANNT